MKAVPINNLRVGGTYIFYEFWGSKWRFQDTFVLESVTNSESMMTLYKEEDSKKLVEERRYDFIPRGSYGVHYILRNVV